MHQYVQFQFQFKMFGKAHMCSAPSLSSLPKVALETVPTFVWLNTDSSRPRRVECRPLPFSTHLSFRRSRWRCSGLSCPCSKNSQASEHPCPAKLQTRCDICCACKFIPTDSGMPRAVDPQKSFAVKDLHSCVPVGAASGDHRQ